MNEVEVTAAARGQWQDVFDHSDESDRSALIRAQERILDTLARIDVLDPAAVRPPLVLHYTRGRHPTAVRHDFILSYIVLEARFLAFHVGEGYRYEVTAFRRMIVPYDG